MATKKKKKASSSSSTALVKRNDKGLASTNKALQREVTGLRSEIAAMQGAMVKLAEMVQDNTRAQTEAPPPLFMYAIDVDYLKDHDCLLVSIEVQNNGRRELSLDRTCRVAMEGRGVAEMPDEYYNDIELDGVEMANKGATIPSGLLAAFAWAFEAPGGCVGRTVSVAVRVAGQDVIEACEVRAFEPDRVPTSRKAPKLLPAHTLPTGAGAPGEAGKHFDAGEPATPALSSGLWRQGD